MVRYVAIAAIFAPLFWAAVPAVKGQDSFAVGNDQIFRAVLRHTVRPHVITFSLGMGIQGTPPLLVLSETMSLCQSGRQPSAPPCVGQDVVKSFAGTVSSPTLKELADSFFARNRNSAPFPTGVAPDVVLISNAGLQDTLRQWQGKVVGYLGFSQPGYSADGRAVVWVSYACGRCGRGWLFLLHQESGDWLVDDSHLLIIS